MYSWIYDLKCAGNFTGQLFRAVFVELQNDLQVVENKLLIDSNESSNEESILPPDSRPTSFSLAKNLAKRSRYYFSCGVLKNNM